MIRFSNPADSVCEGSPRCEEVRGVRHMTLRHHWRLQLMPEVLTSRPSKAKNSINPDSILMILISIDSFLKALQFGV